MAAGDTARLYHRLTSSRYGPGLEWPEPSRPVPVGDPRMLADFVPLDMARLPAPCKAYPPGVAGRPPAARLGAGRRIGDLGPGRPARRSVDRPRSARPRPAAPPVRRGGSRHGARRSSLAVPRGRVGGRPLPARGLPLVPRGCRASGRRPLVRPDRPRTDPGRAAGRWRSDDADRHRGPVADRLEIRGARASSRVLGCRHDARADPRTGGFGRISTRACGRASPTSRSPVWSAPMASTSSRSRWWASATRSRRSAPAGEAVRGAVDAAPTEFPLVTRTQHAGDGDRLGEPWAVGPPLPDPAPASDDLDTVILRRGSTRVMDAGASMPRAVFDWSLAASLRGSRVPHFVAVHAVEGLAPGLYRWPDLETARCVAVRCATRSTSSASSRSCVATPASSLMAAIDLAGLDDAATARPRSAPASSKAAFTSPRSRSGSARAG